MDTRRFRFPGGPFRLLLCLVTLLGLGGAVAEGEDDGAAVQAAMKGTWESVIMDLGDGVYIKTTMTYDGAGHSTDKVVFFSDAGGTSPTGLVKTNTSTYKIGKKIDLGEGEAAQAIDVVVVKWELKQGGSVVKSGGPLPPQYDLFLIKDDTLYNSGLTRVKKGPILDPAARPMTLDKTNLFKKQ
jgi:hypothetical protein